MAERLTDRGIAALKAGRQTYLYLRLRSERLGVDSIRPASGPSSSTGARTRRQRRITIGRLPTWTIGKARTHASKLRLKADVGDSVVTGRAAGRRPDRAMARSGPTDAAAGHRHRLSAA